MMNERILDSLCDLGKAKLVGDLRESPPSQVRTILKEEHTRVMARWTGWILLPRPLSPHDQKQFYKEEGNLSRTRILLEALISEVGPDPREELIREIMDR